MGNALVTNADLLQRLPCEKRLSVPRPAKTLLSNVKHWAEPLAIAHQKLKRLLSRNPTKLLLDVYYNDYCFVNDFNYLNICFTSLLSAALLLNWLLGRSNGVLNNNASLSEAERWFKCQKQSKEFILDVINKEEQQEVLSSLRNLNYDFYFLDMFPYLCEIFETKEILGTSGQGRKSKRTNGIFYTPSDVTDYVIRSLIEHKENQEKVSHLKWLDPACGTGAFLLSIIYELKEKLGLKQGEIAFQFVKNNIFGIDISPIAVQSAIYIITAVCMQRTNYDDLIKRLHTLGRNFLIYDATEINSRQKLGRLQPRLSEGADCVVSNPPYSTQFQNKKRCNNIYVDFVYMLKDLTNPKKGVGGIITPLSLTFSNKKELRELREYINFSGEWKFTNFDRTPDSLFGDDVKVRNSIVFYNARANKPPQQYSTDLVRWNSRTRNKLFNSINFANITKCQYFGNAIAKVGDTFGLRLVNFLYGSQIIDRFENVLTRASNQTGNKLVLKNKTTAYNWLPFELITNPAHKSKLQNHTYWVAKDEANLMASFSLFHSKLAYWLWRVWGDGFHLTNKFILSLPLSPKNFTHKAESKLICLAEKLWQGMLTNPVTNRNSGNIVVSFSPFSKYDTVDEIDNTIIEGLGLPEQTSTYLKRKIKQTVIAGREKEIDSSSNNPLRDSEVFVKYVQDCARN